MSFINSYRFGGAAFDFFNALLFNGTSNYLDLVGGSISTQFVISCWVKTSNTSNRMIFGGGTSTRYIYMINNGGTIRISSTTNQDFTVTNLADGNWHHLYVQAELNGSNFDCRVVVDGSEASEGKQTINATSTGLDLLYMSKYSGGLLWDGVHDESIYKRLYTPSNYLTEAQSLYNSGNGVDSSTIISSPTWHLKLNESGSAITATDSSSNGNDATLRFFTTGMWVAH